MSDKDMAKDARSGDQTGGSQPPLPAGARKSDPGAAERLAAALRDNLRRRKQQARGRKSAPGGGDAPDEA